MVRYHIQRMVTASNEDFKEGTYIGGDSWVDSEGLTDLFQWYAYEASLAKYTWLPVITEVTEVQRFYCPSCEVFVVPACSQCEIELDMSIPENKE